MLQTLDLWNVNFLSAKLHFFLGGGSCKMIIVLQIKVFIYGSNNYKFRLAKLFSVRLRGCQCLENLPLFYQSMDQKRLTATALPNPVSFFIHVITISQINDENQLSA